MSTIEVELSSEHDAAAQARLEITKALSGTALADLTDDATLVVSELVTNALLHGAPPVRLTIDVALDRVRLGVFDSSPTPPGHNHSGEAAMTGRGLMVVEALTVRRGVDRHDSGKEVWAELAGKGSEDAGDLLGAFLSGDELLEEWAALEEPADVVEVDLGEVSTKLLVAAKTHMDNLIREFTLTTAGADTGGTAAIPEDLARLMMTVTTDFAEVRRQLRDQALASRERGEGRTHIRLGVRRRTAEAATRYLDALDEVDAYCRAGRLLTLETPTQHKVFRRWYVGELIRQVQRSVDGLPPQPPQPFEDRLLDELDHLAEAGRAADRAARLHRVAAALSAAGSPERVAEVVLQEAVPALSAVGGGLLVPAGTKLSLPGSVGYRAELVSALRSEPAEADLPAATALRSKEAVWLESREELDRRFPEMRSLEPDTVAVCAVPLTVDSAVGAIRFSFAQPRLFDADERSFVTALAVQAAHALDRIRLLEEERAAADQLAFLGQASGVLAESLDYEQTLRTVAELAVSTVADWCAIYLAGRGEIRTVAISHLEPDAARWAWDLDSRLPSDAHDSSGVANVIRTGRAEFYPQVTEELLATAGLENEPAAIEAVRRVRSTITAPMTARGRTFGAIVLARSEESPPYEEEDLAVALGLAQRAALAVDNAVLYQQRDEVTQALQRTLLPPALPSIPGVEVAAAYRPAAEEVGGDFYDLWPVGEGTWAFAVGDVCGTGAEAAGFTAVVRATLRAISITDPRPGAWLRGLNESLLKTPAESQGESFCTAVAGTLRRQRDGAVVELATGGHPPPLLRRPGALAEAVSLRGTLIGVFDDVEIGQLELSLRPGDQIIIYTDGATEARLSDGSSLGERGLVELVGAASRSASPLVEHVVARLWADQPPDDDVALLVLGPTA